MGKKGAIKDLLAVSVSQLLQAELTAHLGYEKYDSAGMLSGNNRNGSTRKYVATEHGQIVIEVPRDRNGTFEPVAVHTCLGITRTERSSYSERPDPSLRCQ